MIQSVAAEGKEMEGFSIFLSSSIDMDPCKKEMSALSPKADNDAHKWMSAKARIALR